MIQTKDLTRVYKTEDVQTTALDKVCLQIDQGEFVAVMGPSGCGKSTLLNILGMLDTPSDGDYVFLGENISRYPERFRARLRKRSIGFVFQSFNLVDELTVEENIELPLLYLGMTTTQRKKRVAEVMEEMTITHRRKHFPQQLSGGQQQRVAVGRAVVAKPTLILADEPTGNLDSINGREVMKILATLNDSGTTIVMVTHSPSQTDYAGRVIHLFDGQVVSEKMLEHSTL